MTPQEEIEYWKNKYEELEKRIRVITIDEIISGFLVRDGYFHNSYKFTKEDLCYKIGKEIQKYISTDLEENKLGDVKVTSRISILIDEKNNKPCHEVM